MLEPLRAALSRRATGWNGERTTTVGDEPRQEQLDLSVTSTGGDAPAPTPAAAPVQGGLFPDDSLPDELV